MSPPHEWRETPASNATEYMGQQHKARESWLLTLARLSAPDTTEFKQ